MATQGAPKKKSFLLKDVVKLCKSIAKLWPRDKHGLSSCSSFDLDPKSKPKTKSKRNHHHQHHQHHHHHHHIPSQNLQGVKGNEEGEGERLHKVHSYRYDGGPDFARIKKPYLSRSCSQNTATPLGRDSSFSRSKSSFNGRDHSVSRSGPLLTRTGSTATQRSFKNPILYSTSSASVAKPPPTVVELVCTLEELCNGCTKTIVVERDVITNPGEMSRGEETVEIKVKPGWRGGTKVTFKGKGNEAMGSVPADLTFVIAEKKHELFTRDGDDLHMEVEIPLLEALTGCEISVPLPDGDNMNLRIDDVIRHGHVALIQGKGMPRLKQMGERGDLRIRFRTKFPERLTEDQRAEILSILEGSA